MAEFCGHTSVGIYSLLFYRSGETFCHDFFTYSDQIKVVSNDKKYCLDSCLFDDNSSHCGCGLNPCGRREFYIPFDLEEGHLYQDSIHRFDRLASILNDEPRTSTMTASEVYEKVFTNIPADSAQGINTTDERLNSASFSSLRFWESPRDQTNHDFNDATTRDVAQHQILDNEIEHPLAKSSAVVSTVNFVNAEDGVDLSAHKIKEYSNFGRHLPPLLQILLLKLLYVSPKGGPFLYLACEAVPHISVFISRSANLSQVMADRYKSHWAYFTFIRYVVLGERMKKNRRKQNAYHIPIWDIVHHLDSRYDNPFLSFNYDESMIIKSSIPPQSPRYLNISDHIIGGYKPLFAVGDSHVISVGWQTIRFPSTCRVEFRHIVPLPVTGLKAWHVRDGTKFFTHYNLCKILDQLPSWSRSIIFSAGEIDCREGIGGERLEGYRESCTEEVIRTVREYVQALELLSQRYNLQILVMPVAPHAARSDKNGRKLGRARRRERMICWNDTLREECKAAQDSRGQALFLLDYEMRLRYPDDNSVGFVLNPSYNADYTHMNAAFLTLLEDVLLECGCSLQLL